jgi:hypothetical protein
MMDLEICVFGDKRNIKANPGMEARLNRLEWYAQIIIWLLVTGIPSIVAAVLHK